MAVITFSACFATSSSSTGGRGGDHSGGALVRLTVGVFKMSDPSNASTPGSDPSPTETDALKLLETDHAAIQTLFDKFENQKERSTPAQLQQLAAEICNEIVVHAQIEEEIFYPAVREACEDCVDLLNQAKIDHSVAKQVIAKIEQCSDADDLAARVNVLAENIAHHVNEEQNELFPKVREAELDLHALGKKLDARKMDLMHAGSGNSRSA